LRQPSRVERENFNSPEKFSDQVGKYHVFRAEAVGKHGGREVFLNFTQQ
jgi:hypothetical protein